MSDNVKYVQTQATTLYGSGAVLGSVSVILSSLKDLEGNLLTMADFGTIGYGCIEPGTSGQEEAITFTGITQNSNGTTTLTGVKNQSGKSPYTQSSGLLKSHAGGTLFVLSDTAGFYDAITGKNNDETITGTWTFDAAPLVPDDATGKEAVNYDQVAGIVVAGGVDASTTIKGISKMSSNPIVATSPVVLNAEEVSAVSGTSVVVRAGADGKIDQGFLDLTENFTFSGTTTLVGNTIISGSSTLVAMDSTTTSLVNRGYVDSNIFGVYPSSNLRVSADADRYTNNNSYTKYKEILVYFFGLYTVKFDGRKYPGKDNGGYARVYIDGTAVGTQQNLIDTNYTTFSQDFLVYPGQLIQIYARTNAGTYDGVSVANFRLYYDYGAIPLSTYTPVVNIN